MTDTDRGEKIKKRKTLIRTRKRTQIHMNRSEENKTDNDREEKRGVN